MINPLGVFAKTFRRDTLEANLDAVRGAGFDCVQYNLACAGLPTLPDTTDDQMCARIREAHQSRQLTMAAISGTFNIIDDDAERRQANFALRHSPRVLGLVQSRAAWLAEPHWANVKRFGQIADWIRGYGAAAGLDQYYRSELYRQMLQESPDVARSLAGQFQSPRAEETVVKLERIPRDRPCHAFDELATIAVPTLVMANRHDPIHPYSLGRKLAETIAGAEFVELTAKSVSEMQHVEDVQKYLAEFLQRHFQ